MLNVNPQRKDHNDKKEREYTVKQKNGQNIFKIFKDNDDDVCNKDCKFVNIPP